MRMTTKRWHGVTWRFRVISFNAFSEIFKAPKFGMGFLGLILGLGIYLNFVGSLLGLYWAMIYASIRSFPSLKVRSTPLGLSNIGGVWKGEGEVAGGGRGGGYVTVKLGVLDGVPLFWPFQSSTESKINARVEVLTSSLRIKTNGLLSQLVTFLHNGIWESILVIPRNVSRNLRLILFLKI